MGRRRKDADDTNAAELYAKLHESMGYDAASLRAQALILNAGKKNRDFMRQASADLGRDARRRARAVDWFKPYFTDEAAYLDNADHYLSLFAYASLSHEQATECFAANKFDFPLYVIRERVEAAKPKRDKKPGFKDQVATIIRRAVGFARSGKADSLEPGIEWLASELCNIKELDKAVNESEGQDADEAQ